MWMRQDKLYLTCFIGFVLKWIFIYKKQLSKTTWLVLHYKCFFGFGLPDSKSWSLWLSRLICGSILWLQNWQWDGLYIQVELNAWKEQNESGVISLWVAYFGINTTQEIYTVSL